MRKNRPLRSLRLLRTLFRFRQKEFADYLGISIDTLKALESGRRRLTPKMAARIADKTGVGQHWLLKNRGKPILDESGHPYLVSRFREAQRLGYDGLEYNPYLLRLERMEFAQVYFLLCKIADSYAENLHGRIRFKKRLEKFMKAEEIGRPKLHRQLQAFRIQWRKQNAGRFPIVSWLFPRDPEVFDVLIDDLRANKRALDLHLRALDEASAKR